MRSMSKKSPVMIRLNPHHPTHSLSVVGDFLARYLLMTPFSNCNPYPHYFPSYIQLIYSRTSLSRTSLSRTYPYVEVFTRSRSHCSLFQYNSTSIRRIYISKFIHMSNEFQSPITIVRTYSHIFSLKLICKRQCLRSIRSSHLSTGQLW